MLFMCMLKKATRIENWSLNYSSSIVYYSSIVFVLLNLWLTAETVQYGRTENGLSALNQYF